MNSVSLRQPLVLYAAVLMVLLALFVATLASFALVRASQRAYRRGADSAVRTLAQQPTDVLRVNLRQMSPDMELSLVPTASVAPAVLTQIERAAGLNSNDSDIVAARTSDGKTFLVGQLDRSIPSSIAFVEVSRLLPVVLMAAMAAAALLAFLIGRILLPPLSALAEVAKNAQPEGDELEPEAPNEFVVVARRFRQTVRRLHDERERVMAQKDELAQVQESLVRASKLASVGRLAAGIAHEIGNPLAAVQGYLSLMKMGLDPDESRDVLDRCLKELGRIHETIKKLLTYARQGESAKEPPVRFSLQRVIDDAWLLVKGHPALRGVEFDFRSDELPEVVGHPSRLNQVFVNLFLNAGQAMEGQNKRRLRVRIETDLETIRLLVEDTGPGVTAEQLPLIFDPFFTTKAPGEGTGLGLAVSRALMEGMGGDLWAESSSPGARFWLRIPRVLSPEPARG